jgi:Sec-independent protein secretion pathway component TatC
MAVVLQILFEISVWVAWYWERREKKRERES